MTLDLSAQPTLAVSERDFMNLKAHPIADLFPMMKAEEHASLVESIKRSGLRVPIVILDGMILDGRNRYRACQEAGVAPTFVTLRDGENPWLYVWDHNAEHRVLLGPQKVLIWADFNIGSEKWVAERREVQEQANRRRSEATKAQPRTEDGTRVAPRSVATLQTTRETHTESHAHVRASKATGTSPRTAAGALALLEKAPELAQKVRDGEMPLKKAEAEVKRRAKDELGAKLDAMPVADPEGPFDVIVLDPPWQYTKRAEDHTHRARLSYPDMTTEAICGLPVAKLAGDNCVLWLWTTNAFMRDAFRCLDAWGFTEKTILTWVKDRMGTGDWLRGKTEHCIMSIRGRPMVTLTNQTTFLEAPLREHSRKPDEFFDLVKALCHGAKLEMFARERRDGWQAWGAEIGKF
jgi:N6-adenosine-specific RNA methylase IME4